MWRWIGRVEGKRAGRDDFPSAVFGRQSCAAMERRSAACFAARMRKLNGGHGAHPLDESCDAREWLDVAIVIDPHVTRCDSTFRRYRCRFDEHKTRATSRAAAEMNQVPIIRESIDR